MMLPGPWLVVLLIASIAFIILVNVKLHLHIFLVLLLASYLVGLIAGIGPVKTVEIIAVGFGSTLKSIGIVIIFGCIIAAFLEGSGAIYVMADAVLRFVGKARSVLATSLMGFIVSIPVFCDSGFVVLSPLAKAMAKRLKYSATVFGVALSTGLYATHCLVPPTPGPIACAGLIGADLGLVIALGLICSVPALFAGLWYATRIAKRYYIEPKIEITYEEAKRRFKKLPSTYKSFLPIVVPIILICLRSFAKMSLPAGALLTFFDFIGDPITALFIGLGFAFALVPPSKEVATGWVERGFFIAAVIVFITGAGGAFGAMLEETGIGTYLGEALVRYHLWLFLPFLIAALLKTAQGSSTVALITTPAIVEPMLPSLGLTSPVALALTVLAIGSGAMVVSHANDSYFWVTTRLTGIDDVSVGYKTQTAATFVEGTASIIMVLILGAILL
jgi:GntP family gluconate:H+ symporter